MLAASAMLLALALYSIGVWSERLARRLKPWHLVFFWAGLVADATGTTLMTSLPNASSVSEHMLTGTAAIVLMLLHATWATVVLIRKDERLIASFHRFSLVVWLIWLIPFLDGVIRQR
jgi:uncharacterized repeat protein (TIGR03987 family)